MLIAWVLLAVIVVLIVANALFVAIEFSFLTVNRNQVRTAEEAGDRTAAVLEQGLTRTSSNLSGAQLGITVTSLITGFLIGPSLGLLLMRALDLAGVAAAAAIGIATVSAFILVTFAQMVFGELIPKNWTIAEPMRVARLVVYPQRVFITSSSWSSDRSSG